MALIYLGDRNYARVEKYCKKCGKITLQELRDCGRVCVECDNRKWRKILSESKKKCVRCGELCERKHCSYCGTLQDPDITIQVSSDDVIFRNDDGLIILRGKGYRPYPSKDELVLTGNKIIQINQMTPINNSKPRTVDDLKK